MGRFNLVQPSLIQQLRSILDQYQDDGQILKELVQNAEDAGASEVKFLLDETQHETKPKYLHHPELAEYQGPALYAYNNALFSDQDWVGLKMISDSVKKNDAMKVGRFGLGFKSVFHMTDLPSVISGEKLSFIDPHERFFVEEGKKVTGYTWHLKDDYKDEGEKSMKKLTAQFDPYKGLFGCSDMTFKQGHYNGTMFRFPLRNKQSQLSNNLYNTSKVQQVFQSFQSIAELVLLFLTSVESIELYRRAHGQIQPELVFKVQISPDTLHSVRQQRQAFLSKLGQGKTHMDVKGVFPVTIETIRYEKFKAYKSGQTYMISQFCAGSNTLSQEMTSLLADPTMSYIPWVGAACPLNADRVSATEPSGHVFCFLPLPLQKNSMSGLPVHVNGFFAVSSNRHQLKWPSINATTHTPEKVGVTDKSCLWNELVLEEVLPKAIFHLIMEAIEFNKRSQTSVSRAEDVFPSANFIYNLIPDSEQVADRWKLVLPLLFKLLSQAEFIMSNSNYSWQKYQKVILLKQTDDDSSAHNVLLKSLILAGVNAAILPAHLDTALHKYMSAGDMFASPELMRLVMRKKPTVLNGLTTDDKLTLLGYLLTDSKYDLMDGLPLLPLSNGEFCVFSTDKSTSCIYIPTEAHPSTVLPMIENQFIDVSNKIDDKVLTHLKSMASKESTQLRIFSARLFSSLLPELITPKSLLQDQYYCEILWEYIAKNFTDISQFEGLPLILEYTDKGESKVHSLSSERSILSCCGADAVSQLDPNLYSALLKLGIRIVYQLPRYLVTSTLLQNKYVYPPTAKGIKDILRSYSGADQLHDLSVLSLPERESVRAVLSKLTAADISEQDIAFIKSLPLFRAMKAPGVHLFITVNNTHIAAPFDSPPLPDACLALDVRDSASKALSELLGIQQMSKATLLLDNIIPAIERGQCNTAEICDTMISILQNLELYVNEDAYVLTRLQSVKCILREDNSLVPANQCYDPTDKLLASLLYGELLFPAGHFANTAIIESLKLLGLKTGADIDTSVLALSAKKIEEMSLEPAINKKLITEKSLSLMNYLNTHTNLLNSDSRLMKTVKNSCWIVPKQTPPRNLPSSLAWYRPGICSVAPEAICSEAHVTLISSVLAVLPMEPNSELRAALGWDKDPPIACVVEQLANVITSYRAHEKGAYMNILTDIYSFLSQLSFEKVKQALADLNLSDWVWHGDGFVSPTRIVLEKSSTSLSPYVYSLPAEMNEFTQMLSKAGSWATCTSDVLLKVLSLIRDKYKQIELFDRDEVNADLRLVLDIINLLKPRPGETLPPDVQNRLLVPVITDNENLLSLCPVTECTFCDTDWLKERRSQLDHNEAVTFIHPSISNELAEQLGVPSLVNRMLDTDTFELGEGFGQSEPLTRRLHNLLKEYSDGFAVPKELLQNADDAGATEVKFLYDERTNKDSLSCLIDDGMKECQGPALWVYNNAVFTDSDFEAIIKLSGATKSKQAEKIGGFGLGFNAVYNLTDVPSFVSRNYVVIFDPHTTHLGKSIPDASKPGIKIDLKKNHKALGTLKNQFKPYTGVFGCDLQHKGHGVSYDGTLFRFPLRNKDQSHKSEISDLHYDRNEMIKLLEMFARSCDALLLFTQNVKKVSVYHLMDHHNPAQANLLFSVSKEPLQYIRELRVPVNLPATVKGMTEDEQEFTRQSSILKAASTMLQSTKMRMASGSSKSALPESSLLLMVRSRRTREGVQFLHLTDSAADVCVPWLVTSCMGDGDAMDAALKHEGLTPVGGVAVPLRSNLSSPTGYSANLLLEEQTEKYTGALFCYLPLPISSGLPVHINGAFAVTSNRRNLIEKVTDNKTNQLVEWNHALMSDSICKAYILLLEDIKALVDQASYEFYLLWPRVAQVANSLSTVVMEFYKRLSSPVTEQKLFSRNQEWVTLANTVLLDSEIRSSAISKQAFTLLDLITASSSNLVLNIPDDIMNCFYKAGCTESINERTLSKHHLYERIFFQNLTTIPPEIRDSLILHALDSKDKFLDDLLKSFPCIPVTPGGEKLSYIQDLITPTSQQLSVLYSKDDGRFPYGTKSTYLSPQRLVTLEGLGMIGSDLPDTELLERAQSIQALYSTNEKSALTRASALLQYMESKLSHNPDLYNDIQSELRKIQFLPVQPRPTDCVLPWIGQKTDRLLSPTEIYPSEQGTLLCLVQPILDQGALGFAMSQRLKSYLGLLKPVTLELVLNQLKVLQENEEAAIKSYQLCKKICYDIYQFLQNDKSADELLSTLGNFILIGDSLVSADRVALQGARDCAPYLYELPYELQKYEHVFRRAGMRDRFEVYDYVKAMTLMYEDYKDRELDNRLLQTILNLATQLNHLMDKKQVDLEEMVKDYGKIYLPSATCQMADAAALCFNDCSWLPDQKNMEFAHSLIPYQIAKRLGVNTKRQETIKSHSQGIPFGQKEKLTKRLKRIMSSYPCGKEIFKELVQNADDAGATQMHFIKDARYHPTEKVFEESWKPLQGPALCVYNNKPFSQSDLEGIQNLGEGSKGQDPNRTGQYGVGFNSVYHLTDSPSFLTNGPEVGEVLCAFDPHCKFVPGATPNEPGRMFNDLKTLKEVFTDVFNCYLPEQFQLDGATMFRFPLRSKDMASTSKISNVPVTLETINDLMKKFKQEMFDVLLFVNNLEEISVSEMAPRGRPGANDVYTVRSKVTQRYAKLRKEFSAHVKEIALKLKNKEIAVQDVPLKEVSYKMTIEDNLGYKETWLVVQRIGFEHPRVVPQSVSLAHLSGDINLLPRGGAAYLLHRDVPKNSKPMDRPKKVFCFLPLPIHTKLPIHINGHFALDHEARRGLWRDEDGGPRTDWNNTLISQVICPAYKRLIESSKEKSFPSLDGITCHMSADQVQELLDTYHGLFPLAQADEQWQILVNSLYRTIANSDSRLFPVFNKHYDKTQRNMKEPWNADEQSISVGSTDTISSISSGSSQSVAELAEVTWYPLLGQSDDMAFFYDKADDEKAPLTEEVKNALIAGGYNILSSSNDIYKAFLAAGVQAYLMTPQSVVEFLKSNRLIMPDLPAPLSTTPFNSIDTLRGIIAYCNQLDGLIYKLDELPFGLTQDGKLHYLNEDDQLFYSTQHELVPECADLFLHCDLVSTSFPQITNDELAKTRVFKPFGVEEFGLYINQTLSDEFCPSNSVMVSWDPDSTQKPNRAWLSKVWAFLAEQVVSLTSEYNDDPLNTLDQLEITLFALQNWCLIPVYAVPETEESPEDNVIVGKEGSTLREISKKLSMSRSRSLNNLVSSGLDERDHFLVPLQHSHMVMDFSQRDSMTDAMRQTLRKLKVPELHHKLIDGKSLPSKSAPKIPGSSAGSQLTRLLCAKVSDPRSVLSCINYCIDRSKQDIGQLLHPTECTLLLKYFSEAIHHDQIRVDYDDLSLKELRTLPFYITLAGQQTPLADYSVYILPQGIPSADIDVWRSKAGVIFLQRNESLTALFNFLSCKALSDVEVYCQFIFEHFEYLSENARIVHLTYIRDRKLPQLTDDEKDVLIARLRTLNFIALDLDGELYPASEFYDAENRLFQLMLEKEKFPPEPFDNYRWIRFLRMIGLNSVVSDEMFVEFAQKIADGAKESAEENKLYFQSKNVAELDEKARILVQELFKVPNLASNEELLGKIKDIPFLCATRVNSKYHEFCPQYGFDDNEVQFISFNNSLTFTKENSHASWTSSYFLPHWADPAQLKSTEVSYDYHEDDELSSLECYKAELSRQLGISSVPSTEQIVNHVKNLSKSLETEEQKKLSGDKSELLNEVMNTVYKLLQGSGMRDQTAADQLKDTSCVLIDGGKTMVKASQLVLNLYEEQQIKPYLYKTPTELSNYNSLFRYLGATERASANQFAAVLDKLYEDNHDETLTPNSLRCAYRAVKGLFSLLSKSEVGPVSLETLYLPGQDARLRPANSLVYNDEPSYSERLMNFSLPFLVDLRECKLHISYFSDIANKLPGELRPLMLTDIVDESLEQSCAESLSSYGAAQILKSRLTSTEFTAGILRLIRHDHMERSEKPKASALKAVQKSLKNVKVVAVDDLITYLKYDQHKIEGSESQAECFVTKMTESANTEYWCLYVQTTAEITSELLVKVAEIVNKIAGGLLQNSIIYLHPILSCPTYEIPLTLDKLRIRQDHHAAKGPTLQPPGSFIPIDMHHLLKQDFVEFEVDEYVGYELEDPEMNNQMGSATYIYATIIEKLPLECAKYDRNTMQFFERYRINIGDDVLPIIVSSLDLYRLHRVIEKKSRNRHQSSNSEVYNDTAFLTTDSGDYLLLSPGAQSMAADFDQGIIVEEDDDEENDAEEGTKDNLLQVSTDSTDGAVPNQEQDMTPSTAEEKSEEVHEVWEETTTVYSELHVDTDNQIPQSGIPNGHQPQEQSEKPKQQKQETPKKPPKSEVDGKPAEIPQFDYPEINEKNEEEIKKVLERQVRAIWKVPEEQRKKALKRLMLKFHPDKNPDRIDLCTKLTQHIRAVIEDIEDGGFVADKENRSDWWSEFINRRAKAYGEQKNDFEEKLKETFAQYASKLGPEYAAGSSGYDAEASRQKFEKFKNVNKRNPVPAEARRWLKQAEADIKSAQNDMNAEDPAYEWVLLKAHQAAEKALKSACYTLDSKKVNLTDLKLISSNLRDNDVTSLAKQLQDLIGPYDHVTYPGNTCFPKVPHEIIEKDKAEKVLEACQQLICKIKTGFIEVMESELRGESQNQDSQPNVDSSNNNIPDDSLALVLVPKSKRRLKVNGVAVTVASSDATIAL